MPDFLATMPNEAARKLAIIEGCYCSDVPYLVEVMEKRQQPMALEDVLKAYAYAVGSLTYIRGSTGSLYVSSTDTIRSLGELPRSSRTRYMHTTSHAPIFDKI